MSGKVKKRNKKKNIKKTVKKSNVNNLKIFNKNIFKHNFVVLKLVSLIGISTICNLESHNSEKYIEEPVKPINYEREISNLNIQFDEVYKLSNYNLNVRFNSVESRSIEIEDETTDEFIEIINDENIEIINDENIEIIDNENIEVQEDNIMLKYKDAMKVLEINEPSLCGMKLSREYESIIIDIFNSYGIDSAIPLTFGDQESDGKWDNNGKISSTNDYGVFQINEGNHQHIYEVFGYSSDDLLYDPIKNAEAAAYLISKIMLRNDVNSLDEIFGMYNGWTNWRNIEWSVNYVNECFERMNQYFPNYSYDNNKELIKRM